MDMPSLAQLQPYLAAVSVTISVATLGFVLNLALSLRQIARDRTEIIEERLRNVREDLERTEKWNAREKESLT